MPSFAYPVAKDRVTLANAMTGIDRAHENIKASFEDPGLDLILEDFASFAVDVARYAVKRACHLGSGLREDVETQVQKSMAKLLNECPMTSEELEDDDRAQRGLFLKLGWVYDFSGNNEIAVKYINELYSHVCDEIVREIKKVR